MMMYRKFLLMIATSTIIMFVLMYLNNYEIDHIFFSETRIYMALLMGATMAVVMLLFMLGMYPDKKRNAMIFAASVLVFSGSLLAGA
jgi:tryptophan-rich sensory protein